MQLEAARRKVASFKQQDGISFPGVPPSPRIKTEPSTPVSEKKPVIEDSASEQMKTALEEANVRAYGLSSCTV